VAGRTTSEAQVIGGRLLCVGLLVALALVLLGFLTGSHGAVDMLAILSAGGALIVGFPMWCVGWVTARRTRRRA
jgi:hypothetical protein